LKLHFSLPWFFTVCLATSSLQCNSASAQVTSDGTTGTVVDANGNSFEINSGTRSGGNLFHSFGEFSVPSGGQAVFNNAVDVSNILSRVTGGNVSNIDGLIQAQGGANLFLINPAGIIFGQGARLDIGGSFYGSTADSILFEDGEFSAVNNLNQPVLTINAPIGLNLRNNPADITINENANAAQTSELSLLSVEEDQSINLIGGDLDLNNAILFAPGGNVTLGGLQSSGIVNINENGNLSFPENVARGNISLDSFGVSVNSESDGEGGTINFDGNNIELLNGSVLLGGITTDSGFAEAQAGNINLNATGAINLSGASNIENTVNSGAEGNSGDININTGSLELIEGASISTTTEGQGNAGTVSINASDTIAVDGQNQEGGTSSIDSDVSTDARGNSGGINITTTNLSLTNGGQVSANTEGQGNAGIITINALDTITINGILTAIDSSVNSGAVGDAGGIKITTANLNLTNGGQVSANTFDEGNAGTITINASDTISIDGENPGEGRIGGIQSSVAEDAVGNGGGIDITTTNLNLTNGGAVFASTFGQGNAGAIAIKATDTISIDRQNQEGLASQINSSVQSNAVGNGGSVEITTANLSVTNGAGILASTFGEGNGGDLTFNISDRLTLEENSTISAQVFETNANGGDITINAEDGFVVAFPSQNPGDGNDIVANSPTGEGGNIIINAQGVLGLEEGVSVTDNGTNDIDASGDVDGVVDINTPNSDAIEGTTQLPNNPVEPEKTITQACVSDRGRAINNLIVTGKGGIPIQPIEPLTSELININGELTQAESPQPAPIQPIVTSKGTIIPAQGVEVKENGDIILTAYPTSNNSRTSQSSTSCGKS
jgi:filamentous hemagglutinin family protein